MKHTLFFVFIRHNSQKTSSSIIQKVGMTILNKAQGNNKTISTVYWLCLLSLATITSSYLNFSHKVLLQHNSHNINFCETMQVEKKMPIHSAAKTQEAWELLTCSVCNTSQWWNTGTPLPSHCLILVHKGVISLCCHRSMSNTQQSWSDATCILIHLNSAAHFQRGDGGAALLNLIFTHTLHTA